MATISIAISKDVETISFWQGAVVVLGRFLFTLIFLFAAPNHFTRQTIVFSASQGVPLASIAVPLSGVVAIAGGLSILLGYRAKLGAWLMVLFLVPVTLNELAAFYDLPIAEPLAMSTVSEMSEKAPLWDSIVTRYGLHATPYDQIAN